MFGRQGVDHLEVASGVVGGPVMPGGINGVLKFQFFRFPGRFGGRSSPFLNPSHSKPRAKNLLLPG